MTMDVFFELHAGLPRQAPGSKESTLRALTLSGLTDVKSVLDIGCGPGAQTIDLAKALPDATITAVDLHEPFLSELQERAENAGLSDRIKTLHADMTALDFEPGSFDLIWSEGAAYIIGVETALKSWRPFLAPGGRMAFTDAVWLTHAPAQETQDFWQAYPDMRTCAQMRALIADTDYTLIGNFTLPSWAWWDGYYLPLSKRLKQLEEKYADDAAALKTLGGTAREIDLYRLFSRDYAYAFFVVCRHEIS